MADLALFMFNDISLLLCTGLVVVLVYLLFFRSSKQPVQPIYWLYLALFFVAGVAHMFNRLLDWHIAVDVALLLVATNVVFMLGFTFFLQGPFWFKKTAVSTPPWLELFTNANIRTNTSVANNSVVSSSALTAGQASDKHFLEEDTHSVEPPPQLAAMLLEFMEQHKPYLEPHITVERLAIKLKVSPKLLSSTINNELQMNFFEMISNYRVNEAKVRLIDTALRDKPICEIMKNCGFNSKSVFNQAFKKAMGVTPSYYRQQHLY